MELKIEFNHQYKKLHEPLFTTIRKDNKENRSKFLGNIGRLFEIYINNVKWFKARLLDVYIKDRKNIHPDFIDYDCENVYILNNESYLVLLLRKDNGKKTKPNGVL